MARTLIPGTVLVRCAMIVVGGLVGLIALLSLLAFFYFPDIGMRKFTGYPPVFAFDVARGTGFAVSADGLIVTNNHVVPGCRRITVSGNGYRAVDAVLIRNSPSENPDLGVIKIGRPTPDFLRLTRWGWPAVPPEVTLTTDVMKASIVNAMNSAPASLVVAGFPGQSRSDTFDRPAASVIRNAISWDSFRYYPELKVKLTRGFSGSPVLDQQDDVIGVVFNGLVDISEYRHARDNEWIQFQRARMVPAGAVVAFLRQSGFDAPPPTQHGDPSRAIFRVFCFRTWPHWR